MKNKYKILYVDDEESNLRIFRDSFRRDFDVITATSATDALSILEKETVDVVITDQRMPLMTGVELLKEINKRYPSIPPQRLIISGYSKDEDIQKAFDKYQLSQFISKPWEYNKLKIIILNALK